MIFLSILLLNRVFTIAYVYMYLLGITINMTICKYQYRYIPIPSLIITMYNVYCTHIKVLF